MKRRFTLLAIASFMSMTVMAKWDGTIAESLTITDGVCEISTEAQLARLAADVNSGTNYYSGVTFIQKADLDLGGVQDTVGIWSGPQWTPIGKDKTNCFKGKYDGNGYVISNLYFKDYVKSNVGLFGYISGATLTQITLANGYVYGAGAVGGICGYAANSTISYCANCATVYGKMEQNGGVCGYLGTTSGGTSIVTDCINYGLVSGSNFTGGVLGRCKDANTSITNCINVGQVFAMTSMCGNLVGFNDGFIAPIINCFYDNQINSSPGATSLKNEIETNTDREGLNGKSTSELCNGNAPSDDFNSAIWYFSSEMYPRLKVNKNKSAIILAATPVLLTSGNKADNVKEDFKVSNAHDTIIWKSGNDDNLIISKNDATIQRSTSIVLIAKNIYDTTYTKKVYLKANKTGKTPIDSLTIESEEDLIKLRDAVNNYGSYKGCANYDGFKGIKFAQTVKISLSNWTEPIGGHNSFKGIYNGNDYEITGINVDLYDANNGVSNVGGLFGCASFGKIERVIVYGNVTGNQSVGGICGLIFKEELSNCTSYCTVDTKTKNQAGGIVGVDKGFSVLTHCYNRGSVNATNYVGGIMSRSNSSTFIECQNYGTISGTNAGGICGNIATGNNVFEKCENNGSITTTNANSGGILGTQDANTNCTITKCINTGEIAGGCGIIGSGGNTINNCLNIGSINSNNGCGIGGGANAIIRYCFNAGTAKNAIATSGDIDTCINIGNVTTKVPEGCHFDKQLYPNMEITNNNGKKTSEMTGDAFKSTLGEENWIYNDGMYPMPKGLENSDYMKLAAIALILDADDNVNSVSKNFKIGTANHVEWSCSNPEKLSFANSHGYITNHGEQDAIVTVYVHLGSIQKTFTLTIKPNNTPVPTMTWDIPGNLDIYYGDTITEEMLSVTISEPNDALSKGKIEYSIALGPCTLDASAEEHTITATFVPNENANDIGAASISKKLKINKATATLEWTPEYHTYTYGASDNKNKIESAVAKVNGEAVDGTFVYDIPALTVGEQTVSITDFISTNYKLADTIVLPRTKTINVDPIAASISWATPASIPYGTALTSQQLSAFSPIEGTLVYKIDDEVVTAASGKILNGGSHTITATLTPTSPNYAQATMSVTLVVDPILPTIVWENPADITFGTLLSDKQLNAKVEGVSGNFTYTPDFGARLKAENNIILRVDFKPKGTDSINYKATYKEVKINVSKADAIIDWEYPANITYGTLLSETQLNANVNGVTGEYNYTPALGAKLNAGQHELKVEFTPTGDDINNCNAVSKTVILTVDKATPEITWDIAETIIAGTALTEDEHLNAKANIGGSFIYKEGENTINEDDVLPAGSHQLTAVFTPADTANYKSKSKSVTVNVAAKTELAITWTAPAPIVYGTLIDSTILNATANIDGTFAYSVKAGEALNAGEHTIIATFTPTDNSYSVTTDTILLQVAKANLKVSVADVTINQGDALPTFVIAYDDFKLNDNESSLTSQVVATSVAATDKAGTFDIVLSGGQSDNYNFEYQNGKLTITASEDTTSVAETKVSVSVYPNPTDGILMVETDSNVENIFIYNAQGTLVKVEPNTGKTRIDISDVEQGTYFVKVGDKTIKLLKF